MTDPELEELLRSTLRHAAEALRVSEGAAGARSEPPGQAQRRASKAPRRPPWRLALATAAAAAVALVSWQISLAGRAVRPRLRVSTASSGARSGGHGPSSAQKSPAGAAASRAPAREAGALSVPTSAVTKGFEPLSVTFVSPQLGWVLGQVPCSKDTSASCVGLARTTDNGVSWAEVPVPDASLSGAVAEGLISVRFANPADGWIALPGTAQDSASRLFYTHDGGAAWSEVSLPGPPGSTVAALEATPSQVQLALAEPTLGAYVLYRSPAYPLAWTASSTRLAFGAGPVPAVQMVLQGVSGWAVENDRVLVATARERSDGAWGSWPQSPCTDVNGPLTLAAASATQVFALCDDGLWGPVSASSGSSPPYPSEWLYRSVDAGDSFKAVGRVPAQVLSLAAAPGRPATLVAGTQDGLLATFDGGLTWQTVKAGLGPVLYVGFTTSNQGVAISEGSATTPPQLLFSYDGGASWVSASL